ncbi:MAG: hypothetical protein HPY59_16060 [Anaerolineae bacterium]|nr:hypothetical protein [Anaerolineae bacterium]
MKFSAWYGIVVGMLMLGQWAFFITAGAVPELQSAPWSIGFHLAAEALTALALILSGIAVLKMKVWGVKLLLVALGMVLYSEIASPGYFAQSGQWALVIMFGVLFAGALAAITALNVNRSAP